MHRERRSFFLSSAEPSGSEGLREVLRLMRDGWVVVESQAVTFAAPAGDAAPPGLRGPANVIVLERRPAGPAGPAVRVLPILTGLSSNVPPA